MLKRNGSLLSNIERRNCASYVVSVNCLSHCAVKNNTADIPSTGPTPLELSVNKLWRMGLE